MKDLERVLKALANGRRLAILKFLARKRRASVSDIAEIIKLSFRSTSRHLSVLKNAGVVQKEQESLTVWHELASPKHALAAKVLELF
ncbi:hypothetical protein A3A39_04110 [Candidatus Kaiserbacteria bacterium RIFCSPLOWO2_01_FULL_54_13]|uniref:HTH arsR-type domain-containing protein n=1 Tax=Candidatus Kaiserbacteria bacterium RIFCSPLOWO2_01_FULL_54_13 TaxID=1798512 RepID=A0A1F6F475_9BACT|nr:MAG: hypothetical protein A3A39_04110 [Candidatus Kaiserbacteria bacterium RIFCSPLOWO2_01_FULL_54_13]